MHDLFQTILSSSIHGSIVILAVLLLRVILKKAPKKYICMLWILAGIRLLLPIPVESALSLQPVRLNISIPAALGKILPLIWGAIAAGVGIYSLVSYIRLRRQVLDAVKIPGGWESDRIDTAFVLGFLKPKIYIPTGMSQETRKQILAHERTHLDKGDQWIKMLGFVALAIHWFNPLVWVNYICLCKDIEMACDERVIQFMELEERKAYSSALLRCSTNQVHYAACPVAFGEVSVKYRIKSILNYRKPAFWLSLLAVLAFLSVGVCLVTNPQTTVEVPVDADEPLRQLSQQEPASFTPASAPECPENPDWGVEVFMDAQSPTSGQLIYRIEERFASCSESITLDNVLLERWNGTDWEPQPKLNATVGFQSVYGMTFPSTRSSEVTHSVDDLDWTLSYGALPAGDYRVSLDIISDLDTATFYAPFHIYREDLPREQETALTRCQNALDSVLQGSSYQVLLSETGPDGNVYPTREITKSNKNMRVDYYVGDMCVSSSNDEDVAYHTEGWEEPFTLDKNRQYLFPQGQSTISEGEITFCTVWADYRGTSYQATTTWCFYEDGTLKSICCQTETRDAQNQVTTSVCQMERTKAEGWQDFNTYISQLDSYEFTDTKDSKNTSPWGIWFRVDDDLISPTAGEVWLGVDTVGVSDYTTDETYWIEKKVGNSWQRLGGKDVTASWGTDTVKLGSKTQIFWVDWSDTYGALEAGVYRMGKFFYQGGESTIEYAVFSVYRTGGVYGVGAEEALTRVDAALEQIAGGTYRVEEYLTNVIYGEAETYLSDVYWKYGDAMAWDIYNGVDGYSHTAMQYPGDFNYNSWMKRDLWDSEYSSVYFPAGYSLISDREIRLVFTLRSDSSGDPVIFYTYKFDENGGLTEIVENYPAAAYSKRYVITDTSEAEIQTWVETKAAEQKNN